MRQEGLQRRRKWAHSCLGWIYSTKSRNKKLARIPSKCIRLVCLQAPEFVSVRSKDKLKADFGLFSSLGKRCLTLSILVLQGRRDRSYGKNAVTLEAPQLWLSLLRLMDLLTYWIFPQGGAKLSWMTSFGQPEYVSLCDVSLRTRRVALVECPSGDVTGGVPLCPCERQSQWEWWAGSVWTLLAVSEVSDKRLTIPVFVYSPFVV